MTVELLASPTPEQEMLVETTARFIEATLPLREVRALSDDARSPDAGYFTRAGELGWFGMLVDERHGGGSASGNGVLDAAAIAAERGAVLQPGPFVATNVVGCALSAAGSGPHQHMLADLVEGRTLAGWLIGDVRGLTPGAGHVVARLDGDVYVLDGTVRHVQDAGDVGVLLVPAEGPDGLLQATVGTDATGRRITAETGLDLTRRSYTVELRDVRVGSDALVATTDALLDRQLRVAAVLAAAEAVGAMHANLAMAVAYAKDRIAFGRPIGSFQAIKHSLADNSLALEMSKGLVAAAAEAVGVDAPDAADLAHGAKAFVSEKAVELTHACFQVFGGIGYTWEHDHHLFMRRLAADAQAFGSADWHRGQLAERIGVA